MHVQDVEDEAEDAPEGEVEEEDDEATLVTVTDAGASEVTVVVATQDTRVAHVTVVGARWCHRAAQLAVAPLPGRRVQTLEILFADFTDPRDEDPVHDGFDEDEIDEVGEVRGEGFLCHGGDGHELRRVEKTQREAPEEGHPALHNTRDPRVLLLRER